jgi:hypothetical protein
VTTDDIVSDYLAELSQVTVGLDPAARAELLQEVGQHIRDALATGEDVSEVLTRLGRPVEIAQAAGLPKRSFHTFARRAFELTAVFLVAAGAVVPPYIGWIVGVIMLWNGPRWTLRDRLIGTLVPPFGASGVLALWPFLSGLGSRECAQTGTDVTCRRVILPGWLEVAFVVVYVSVGLAVAGYLVYRAGRAERSRPWSWRTGASWLGLAPRQVWLVPIFAILVVLALAMAGLAVRVYVQDARGRPVPLRDASRVCGWVGDLSDGGQSLRVDTRGEAAGTGTANVGDVVCVLDQLKVPPSISDELEQEQLEEVRRSRMWDGFVVTWTYRRRDGLDVVIRETQ